MAQAYLGTNKILVSSQPPVLATLITGNITRRNQSLNQQISIVPSRTSSGMKVFACFTQSSLFWNGLKRGHIAEANVLLSAPFAQPR